MNENTRNAWRVSVLVLALVINPPGARAEIAPAGLEVHEWGTFTSMQGSDGIDLEGLHHEEEPLPDFVHNLATLRHPVLPNTPNTPPVPPVPHLPHHPIIHKGLDFDVNGVTQKMETPVIYFHTQARQHVSVHVEFLRGLLTQFFPAPTAVTPATDADAGPVDMSTVSRSSLTWEGDVLPGTHPDAPAVAANDPWAFAREVDAAPFVTTDAHGRSESEHYIFYRGLGSFSLPIRVTAGDQGQPLLANGATEALPVAFTVEVGSDTARFRRLGAVAANAPLDASVDALPLEPKAPAMDRLAAALTADLIAQGLFADEARAMVRTWSRQWFGTPGTRVLYLVPQTEIARVLPLTITPAPLKTVRVLLGRLEYLTPATEAQVESALKGRRSADAQVRTEAEATLAKLNRFLEAHVRRALAHTQDPEVRSSAQQLLATLH